VFETEPLPASSPLWTHPKVTVTPHNAADSEPEALCKYILRQIKAYESGGALENVVDKKAGY
jgi:glyoxylate/hydroxypyruvate reductase A